MADNKELLEQILKNQKRILESIEYQKEKIKNIEERLNKIEYIRTKSDEFTPSLIRVLNELIKSEKPLDAKEISKRINLSRNLTSGYLNKLFKMGYVFKEPNLSGIGSRYLFKVNISAIPEDIKKIITKYKDEKNV